MIDVVWLIPALPLAGFLIILVAGRKLGEPKAGWLATTMLGAAFLVAVGVFIDLLSKAARTASTSSSCSPGSRSARCTSTWRSSSTR